MRYGDEIRRYLESFPSINGIEISSFDDSTYWFARSTKPDPGHDIRFRQGAFPCLRGEVQFSVTIPHRIQAELSPFRKRAQSAETFDVYWRWPGLPVVFVWPRDGTSPSDGSNGVVIVREFLKREAKAGPSKNLILQALGPSPMHANFTFTETNDESLEGFRSETIQRRGYDLIAIEWQRGNWSEHEARTAVMDAIEAEMDLFYEIKQAAQLRAQQWSECRGLVDDLIEFEGSRGAVRRAARARRRYTLLNDAFLGLTHFKASDLTFKSNLENRVSAFYRECETPIIRHLADRAIDNTNEYPATEFLDLVKRFESRSVSATEVVGLGLASLSGGAIGGAVTALLT